jgi:hypothetical protein
VIGVRGKGLEKSQKPNFKKIRLEKKIKPITLRIIKATSKLLDVMVYQRAGGRSSSRGCRVVASRNRTGVVV